MAGKSRRAARKPQQPGQRRGLTSQRGAAWCPSSKFCWPCKQGTLGPSATLAASHLCATDDLVARGKVRTLETASQVEIPGSELPGTPGKVERKEGDFSRPTGSMRGGNAGLSSKLSGLVYVCVYVCLAANIHLRRLMSTRQLPCFRARFLLCFLLLAASLLQRHAACKRITGNPTEAIPSHPSPGAAVPHARNTTKECAAIFPSADSFPALTKTNNCKDGEHGLLPVTPPGSLDPPKARLPTSRYTPPRYFKTHSCITLLFAVYQHVLRLALDTAATHTSTPSPSEREVELCRVCPW
jgi:hypothetical protein